jgi:hypothetical protein
MASWPVPCPGMDGSVAVMAALGTMWSLADAIAPLAAKFGEDLTLWRDGGVACWRYDGQSVFVSAGEDGTIEATFVDRPAVDEVSGELAAAIYRRSSGGGYTMTPDGGTRMADDMSAFFSGARDRRFRFISVHTLRPAG